MTQQETASNATQASVHIILQGKGGVGKSFVSAILAQYFRTKPAPVHCLDTDPINATFAQSSRFPVPAAHARSAFPAVSLAALHRADSDGWFQTIRLGPLSLHESPLAFDPGPG
jgi:hypothetical protein